MNEGHKFISLGYLVLPSLNKAFIIIIIIIICKPPPPSPRDNQSNLDEAEALP